MLPCAIPSTRALASDWSPFQSFYGNHDQLFNMNYETSRQSVGEKGRPNAAISQNSMAVRLVIRASPPIQKAGNPLITSTSSNNSDSVTFITRPHQISHRAAGIFGVSVRYLPCCDAAIAKRHATATLRRCTRPWCPATAMVLPSLLNVLVDSDRLVLRRRGDQSSVIACHWRGHSSPTFGNPAD